MAYTQFEQLFSRPASLWNSDQGLICQFQEAFAILEEHFTGCCQAHMAGITVNELHTQFTFQARQFAG